MYKLLNADLMFYIQGKTVHILELEMNYKDGKRENIYKEMRS